MSSTTRTRPGIGRLSSLSFGRHWLIWVGPATVGFLAGSGGGLGNALTAALVLPAIVISVAVLMLPPLFVATLYLGVKQSPGHFVRAAISALVASGMVMLSLAPALAFLSLSSESAQLGADLAMLLTGFASLVSLHVLFTELGPTPTCNNAALRVLWGALVLGIGLNIVVRTFM